MKGVQALDDLRASSEGCSLTAFGDLRTRLVLRVSTGQSWPQERLDELCAQGAAAFDQVDHPAVAQGLFADTAGQVTEAIVLSGKEIRLFVRSPEEASDVVCCVCQSVEDVQVLTPRALETLRKF